MFGFLPAPPLPALVTPPFPATVAAVLDECQELGTGDGRFCHGEGRDSNRVGPFLVIEDEPAIGSGTELKRSTGYLHVPGKGSFRNGLRLGVFGCAGNRGFGISKHLSRVGKRFVMHVLMKGDEAVKIILALGDLPVPQVAQGPVENILKVTLRFLPGGKR